METIKFSRKDLLKASEKGYRKALVEEQLYARPNHKVHKNKKKYNRKTKHRADDSI